MMSLKVVHSLNAFIVTEVYGNQMNCLSKLFENEANDK